MDAEVEGEEEMHPSERPRVAERVPVHVPPAVEPQNRDFDVNEFYGQARIQLWLRFFGVPKKFIGQHSVEGRLS